ncbi:hypothetical protein GGS24DRAFT_295783 [Hypoxylon argillaceum]|nr:hypothetical protein GGS24DRAFT_295783 [Hypoxylon argillaceum]
MDPLSALAAASSVLQIVDFGTRLLVETKQVYTSASGRTAKHVALSEIADDLAKLSANAREFAAKLSPKSQSAAEIQFLRLCGEAEELAKDLQACLEKLRRSGVTKVDLLRSSFKAAAKSVWPDKKVNNLANRLVQLREKMAFAAIVAIWEEEKLGISEQRQLVQQHSQTMESINSIQEKIDIWGKALVELNSRNLSEAIRRRDQSIHALWAADWQPAENWDDFSTGVTDELRQQLILGSLSFPTMEDREFSIPYAYESTYKWVLQEGGTTEFSNFSTWLRSSTDDIYWITGKPGAGKSTLMKYIYSSSDTASALQSWADTVPLVIANFFFWNSGTTIQRSQDGLLRTLLYQCLKQQPQLLPKACGKRWALTKLLGMTAREILPMWTRRELEECLNVVASEHGKTIKLAMFVDGLDEFEGDHSLLVNFLKQLVSVSGLKLCVSSRPWNVFEDTFKLSPSLRLELLTKNDMKIVVKRSLSSNPGYQDLKSAFPEETTKLEEDIVPKAQGVFLWVTLVVRSLLEGLTEGDRISDLRQRLEELPDDLEQLFQKMLDSVDKRYIKDTSHYIRWQEASISGFTLLTLWALDEPDDTTVDPSSLSVAARTGIERTMSRRLNSRTKGLLETSESSSAVVTYIHRTVRDWILRPDIWARIISLQSAGFDPNLSLCHLGMLKCPIFDKANPDQFWREVMETLNYARKVRPSATNNGKLMRILDSLSQKFHKREILTVLNPNGVPPKGMASWVISALRALPLPELFLGLTAVLGIETYVKEKLAEEPYSQECLQNLFTCAVLGPLAIAQMSNRWHHLDDANETAASRVELVKFLHNHLEVKQTARALHHYLFPNGQLFSHEGDPWHGYWMSVKALLRLRPSTR